MSWLFSQYCFHLPCSVFPAPIQNNLNILALSLFSQAQEMRGCRSGQTGQAQDLLAQCLRRFEPCSSHLFSYKKFSGFLKILVRNLGAPRFRYFSNFLMMNGYNDQILGLQAPMVSIGFCMLTSYTPKYEIFINGFGLQQAYSDEIYIALYIYLGRRCTIRLWSAGFKKRKIAKKQTIYLRCL